MGDEAEQQAEEVEVLTSIYEGDENFKQVDSKTYQYKYIDGDKSFVLEILWGPNYPTEKPSINLDIFYNQNLLLDAAASGQGYHVLAISFNLCKSYDATDRLQSVKDKIMKIINEEADQWVGSAMTYTLFECPKDKLGELLEEQTEEVIAQRVEKINIDEQCDPASKKPEKKEHLTKAQKRRAWDRAEVGKGGEKPRGWDWVDIVKHLSQVPHEPHS